VELQKLKVGQEVASQLKPGVELYMANRMKVTVTDVSKDTFTIDANPPLAGASYQARVRSLNVQEGPKETEFIATGDDSSPFQLATFALDCFWGGKLDFM
jgi:FKBP-type peptidyl-prolyl cis-trans isomerase 2